MINSKKIIKRYIKEFDITSISCLVVRPITVYSYGFLFNCTTVGQASDSDGTDVKLESVGRFDDSILLVYEAI